MVNENRLMGETLKRFRKQKKMTLQQLAQETGISTGYISKIERDSANPSVQNIQKICYALGITANELMIPRPQTEKQAKLNGQKFHVIRKDKHTTIYSITDTLSFESVFEGLPQFKVNVMTLVDGMDEQSYSVHTYDEFGIVAKGKLGITLDDDHHYELDEGDCILVRANTKHSVSNRAPGDCIAYWLEVCS